MWAALILRLRQILPTKKTRPSVYRRSFSVSIFRLIDCAVLFCLKQAEESVLILFLFKPRESESCTDSRTFVHP